MAHAKGPGLGVHRLDECVVTARVVVRQGRGGAVFRRHQGDQQHVLAVELAAQLDPRIHPLHFLVLGDGDREHLVHVLLGVEHHHTGHQLGHRSNRHHPVGIVGVEHLVGLQIDQQGAAGGQVQFRWIALLLGRGLSSSGRREGRSTCEQQEQAKNRKGSFHVEAH
ncbi:hypothetical protein D3C85_1166540 [compost metagenome]